MKKIKKIILVMLILVVILLTGCVGTTHNDIVNKVVRYEDVSITEFNQMIKVAVSKAAESSIAVIAERNGIITSNVSLGSGVIIKRVETSQIYTYYALTNRHVVDYKGTICRKVNVIYNGNASDAIEGTTIEYDSNVDIALIKFETTILFEPANIGINQPTSKGDIAIAYGTPYSLEYFGTANFGIISNTNLSLVDQRYNSTAEIRNTYIQHDASINSGNSGGGLFNIYGNLIGINTKKLVGTSSDPVEGMGFAIPITVIKQLPRFASYFY